MFAIIEHERFAIDFRNALERSPENGFLLATDGLFGWKGFIDGGVQHFIQRRGAVTGFASILAEAALNFIAGDAREPSAKLGWFAQRAKLGPGGEKRFLRDVFPFGHVAGGGVSERADQCLIAFDDV